MADLVTVVPPSAVDAEAAILGSLMIDGGMVPLVAGLVSADDFHTTRNAAIYRVILAVHESGRPADPITLSDALAGRLDEVGGLGYLLELIGAIPTASRAEHYARLVREKAGLRRLAAAGDRIMRAAYEPGVSYESALGTASRELAAAEALAPEPSDDMALVLDAYEETVEARRRGEGRVMHLSSPWYDVDQRMTLGAGDLAIVAGRPGMGKTAVALNWAWHVSQSAWVDFYSLEMSRERLLDRLTVMISGVPARKLREGTMTHEERHRHGEALAQLRGAGLRIHEPRALTAASVRRRTIKAQARGQGSALVVVDYIQLMEHPRASRPDLEIGASSRQLKLLANEAGIVVMALSQLSRPEKQQTGKRPGLTDLRGSGDLEQDADEVIFPHRPAYYEPGADPDADGLCELIVAKNRHGAPCAVNLEFKPRQQVFTCPEHREPVSDWRTE
ncbi:MAG: AAA family ATPase [Chromatiaceae bacterium]|jgi:replicative DNA helicase|nr:AAA family ATPase [Chromatiaceae bacterium]